MTISVASHWVVLVARWMPQAWDRTRRHTRRELPVRGVARPVLFTLGLAFALAMALGLSTARAQEQRKRKIPVVDKITQGSSRQAFSGKIESLNLELHVLQVNASEGKTVEIFPIKNGVRVSTAGGEKLKLQELRQGNNVIIYYDQKGDRRTVKQIVVLATSPDEEPKKPAPSS